MINCSTPQQGDEGRPTYVRHEHSVTNLFMPLNRHNILCYNAKICCKEVQYHHMLAEDDQETDSEDG